MIHNLTAQCKVTGRCSKAKVFILSHASDNLEDIIKTYKVLPHKIVEFYDVGPDVKWKNSWYRFDLVGGQDQLKQVIFKPRILARLTNGEVEKFDAIISAIAEDGFFTDPDCGYYLQLPDSVETQAASMLVYLMVTLCRGLQIATFNKHSERSFIPSSWFNKIKREDMVNPKFKGTSRGDIDVSKSKSTKNVRILKNSNYVLVVGTEQYIVTYDNIGAVIEKTGLDITPKKITSTIGKRKVDTYSLTVPAEVTQFWVCMKNYNAKELLSDKAVNLMKEARELDSDQYDSTYPELLQKQMGTHVSF